jgi:pimeloyl-ACP methyl ester carboxylesterase
MLRSALAGLLVLAWTAGVGLAQGDAGSKKDPSFEAEYRRLDELLKLLRARNARQYAITSAKGIDESGYVRLGGIEQWVTIRGEDRENPILLFVHGGPGDVTTSLTFAIFAPWQKHFTIVQWDQRGSGRTLRKTGPMIAPTITVERIAQDGIELAEYARKRLGKDKVVIVGHSMGTILGLTMARARPGLFSAYVGTAQVGDSRRNLRAAYDALVKKARAACEERAMAELSKIGPPPFKSGADYQVQRKWANAFEGADQFLYATSLGMRLTAPGYTVADVKELEEGQGLSAERLVPRVRTMGPKELGLEFAMPVYFIQGSEDFTTPVELAREYLEAIKAPRKEFVTIEGGGHFAVFMKPEVFLRELVKRVGGGIRSGATGRGPILAPQARAGFETACEKTHAGLSTMSRLLMA